GVQQSSRAEVIGIGFGQHEPSLPARRRWAQKGPALLAVPVLALSATVGAKAMDRDGLITIQSQYTPKDTMQRLEAGVKAKGMTVFAHIDHAAGAAEVGMALRPTDLLIFGSPKGGTPLMQSAQTIGIDLPLKPWFGRTPKAMSGCPTMIPRGSRSAT